MLHVLLAAALYALSFPPLGWAPLGWVALAPLLVGSVRVGSLRAAGYGLVFGVAMAWGVGWWFPGMIASFFDQSLLTGWLGFFAVSSTTAGVWFGAFTAWVSWLARRGAATPLLVALGWGACELARSRVFVGDPWALLGYSQVGWSALTQVADIGGPYPVGMLMAAAGAIVAGLVEPRLRPRHPRRSAALVLLAVAAVLAYGHVRLRETFTTGQPVAVALVQGGAGSDGNGVAAFEEYVSLSRAGAAGADLVLWPEHAITFSMKDPGARRDELFRLSRDLGAELIVGGLGSEQGSTDVRQYNSAFLVRDGRIAGRYDKVRLMPMGEASLLPRGLRAGRDLVPGRVPRLLRTRNGRVGAFICVESMYPETVRALGEHADLLVNLSNDAWFAHATPAEQQLGIARLRAVENRRALLRATATGISAIVDAHGRVVARSGFGRVEVVRGSVQMGQVGTVYQRWGDAVGWGAVGIALAWSLVVVLVGKPSHRRVSNAS